MTDPKKSVASWTTGNWSGGRSGAYRLDYLDQEITNRYQIRNGSYNAGSYYEFGVYCPSE